MKITSVNNELVKETAKLLQKKFRNAAIYSLTAEGRGIPSSLPET